MDLKGVNVERNFQEIFRHFGQFFHAEITNRGYPYLVHSTNDHYWVPHLVQEFYNCFDSENFDEDHCTIHLVWRGVNFDITPALISIITDIPQSQNTSCSHPLGHYLVSMGPNCSISSDGGIKGSTMYENVYAACRWVQTNIIGGSHMSSFYIPTLHVVDMLMTRDPRICMCRQLIHSIAQTKRTRRKTSLPLPVLVTDIIKVIMSHEQFMRESEGRRERVELEPLSNSYRLSTRISWTPQLLHEDTIGSQSPVDDQDTFWTDPPPTSSQVEFNNHLWEGMRRLNQSNQRIERELGQTRAELEELRRSSSSRPSRRRR